MGSSGARFSIRIRLARTRRYREKLAGVLTRKYKWFAATSGFPLDKLDGCSSRELSNVIHLRHRLGKDILTTKVEDTKIE
jgi:hypothetical protein